jgi:hypothetical protein
MKIMEKFLIITGGCMLILITIISAILSIVLFNLYKVIKWISKITKE